MPISASEYAAMADGAYGPIKGVDALYKMISFGRGRISKDDFSVLESSDQSTVYKKNSTGEVVLAIKGTNMLGDWASNFLITIGALEADPRMIPLINLVGKYRRMGVEISVTGHSLGGALAAQLAKNYNVMAVTFNMGSFLAEALPDHAALSLARKEKTGNIIQFNTGVDLLSVTGPGLNPASKTFFVDPKSVSTSHKMDSFSSLNDSLYQEDIDTREQSVNDYRRAHPEINDNDITVVQYSERVFEVIGKSLAAYKTIVVWADLMKKAIANRGIAVGNLRSLIDVIKQRVKGLAIRVTNLRDSIRAGEASEAEQGIELLRQDVVSLYDATFTNLVRRITRGPSDGRVRWDTEDAWEAAEEQVERTARSYEEFDDYDEMEVYNDDEVDDVDLDGDEPVEIEGDGAELEEVFADLDGVPQGEPFEFEEVSVDAVSDVGAAAELGMGAMEFGVVGGAFYAIFLVYGAIMANERQKKLVLAVNERNANFDSMFRTSTMGAKVGIPVNRAPSAQGHTYRNADLYGDVIFAYLNWRIATPEAMYVGDEGTGLTELEVLSALYLKYLSPGVPLVADNPSVSYQLMTQSNFKSSELRQWVSSQRGMSGWLDVANGWDTQRFMEVYSGFSGFLMDKNGGVYAKAFEKFMESHVMHKFDELDKPDQEDWVLRLEEKLSFSGHAYVIEVMGLPAYVQSIPGNMFAYDMNTAMKSLIAYIVSMLSRAGKNADSVLATFRKTHTMAIVHRGIEQITSDGGATFRWLLNSGQDMGYFQTYFSVGSSMLLSSPVRSVAEQNSYHALIQDQIERDNIDYTFFFETQKGRGDNETIEEFHSRFKEWQKDKAKTALLDTHTPRSYDEYIDQIKARRDTRDAGPVNTLDGELSDVDGVLVCKPKKRKLDSISPPKSSTFSTSGVIR